jgi:hypothetical protein
MSVISPVNRTPSADTDERAPAQPPVALADRIADANAGGTAPKKKKLPVAEAALISVAVPVPLSMTPEQMHAPSLSWGLSPGPTAALAAPLQATTVIAAPAQDGAAKVAITPEATDRRAVLAAVVAPPTVQSPAVAQMPVPTIALPAAVSSADQVPARLSEATAAPLVAPTPIQPAAKTADNRLVRQQADPSSTSAPTVAESADTSVPMRTAPLLPTVTGMPHNQSPLTRPAAPVPAPVPPPPSAPAPAPGMTVAFQSWGQGHQVHAQWLPAGVILTPSSDRVGHALVSATLEGSAAAAEADGWRIEPVGDEREQRHRSRHDAEHDAP